MKRLAIYVEGQTEQIFVSKFLKEIAGEKNIIIEEQKGKYGEKKERKFITISGKSQITDQGYYVLIRDSGHYERVKTDIREQCTFLAKSNYKKILGLRDVYPFKSNDIPKLLKHIRHGIPNNIIPIKVILAIMEIEAWFIAEKSHFQRIHPLLTEKTVINFLGFDPSSNDVETLPHPFEDLNSIYRLAGLSYTKKKTSVERTTDALDYGEIYLTLKYDVNSLGRFISEIDEFLN